MFAGRTVEMPTNPARAMDEMRWLAGKSPDDALTYEFDMTRWLAQAGTDVADATVTTAPATDPADMTASFLGAKGGVVSIRFAAGRAGIDYAVAITISLQNGDTLKRIVWLLCQIISPNDGIGSQTYAGWMPSPAGTPGPPGPQGLSLAALLTADGDPSAAQSGSNGIAV